MDVEFCMEALEEALSHGRPEIFNTDQGAQFTSQEFTGRLLKESIQISMDGKGRAIDNVMVERLLWNGEVRGDLPQVVRVRSRLSCRIEGVLPLLHTRPSPPGLGNRDTLGSLPNRSLRPTRDHLSKAAPWSKKRGPLQPISSGTRFRTSRRKTRSSKSALSPGT